MRLRKAFLDELRPVLENPKVLIVGHDLKRALGVFRWANLILRAKPFSTMLAHSLVEPDMRHTLGYVGSVSGVHPDYQCFGAIR